MSKPSFDDYVTFSYIYSLISFHFPLITAIILILTAKGMVLMVTLPERLRELRKSNNLTQAQVAEILHISRPAYTQYETGNKQPSIETLVKLADLFKTSVDYLIGRY